MPHKINNGTKLAGKNWLNAFPKLYPELFIRQPKMPSFFVIWASTEKFFDMLSESIVSLKIDSSYILLHRLIRFHYRSK